MSAKAEHEREVRELNDQLYSAYKRIKDLNIKVDGLEEDLKGTVDLIAQADTGGTFRNHESNRVRMVINDAKAMTKKYGFFDYWE
jgi:hypothetical protein